MHDISHCSFHPGPENHREYIKERVAKVTVPPFKPKANVTIHTTDSEAQAAEQSSVGRYFRVVRGRGQ